VIKNNEKRTEGGTLISQVHQICQRVWYSVLKRNGLENLAGARGRMKFLSRKFPRSPKNRTNFFTRDFHKMK